MVTCTTVMFASAQGPVLFMLRQAQDTTQGRQRGSAPQGREGGEPLRAGMVMTVVEAKAGQGCPA
ncbi:MAG: hypothetical protein H5T62_15920 [Anaerolineae bacterium]|nr:hypothetical protein [Anaerolineae bacterium]